MAEAFNSLFKAECIRNPKMRPSGGWKSVSDIQIAVAEYVDWFSHRPPPRRRFGQRVTASSTMRQIFPRKDARQGQQRAELQVCGRTCLRACESCS